MRGLKRKGTGSRGYSVKVWEVGVKGTGGTCKGTLYGKREF